MGGYRVELRFCDPKFIEGEISAAQIKQNKAGARDISGFLIDRGTTDDPGDEDCVLLPAAAKRKWGSDWEKERADEKPPEKLAVYAKIDEIMSTKVVANDWAAATARNQAIEELKAKDLY